MSAERDSILARLKKIEALASSGILGERETARRMLEELCEKHGVTPAQIVAPEKTWHRFAMRGERAKALFKQVIVGVLKTRAITHRVEATGFACELTMAQAMDVRSAWAHYKKVWAEAEEEFFTAFVLKHQLVGPRAESDESEEYDIKRLERLIALMRGMQSATWEKRLALEAAEVVS